MFSNLSEELKKAVNDELDKLPKISMKAEISVEGENSGSNEIHLGDLLVLRITVTKENFEEKKTNTVKSCTYPFPRVEKWYVLLGDENRNAIFWFYAVRKTFKAEHNLTFPRVRV